MLPKRKLDFVHIFKIKFICVANDGHVIVAQDSGHLYIFDDHTRALIHKWTFKTNRLSYSVQ